MTPACDLPCIAHELDRIAGLVSRGFRLNIDAARLMILQIAGAVAGRSLVARSVDGIVCTAGIDLGLVGSHKTMLHGAQMALLDPLLAEFQEAQDRQAARGCEHARHRYASLITKNKELQEQRKAAEERLRKLTYVPRTMDEIMACRDQPKSMSIAQQKRDQQMIEASIRSRTKEIVDVQREIADWKFARAAGIIRDEGAWLEFPGAGVDSFDGSFLQLASANSLLQDNDTLPPKWFRESTELLRRSRSESPFSITANSHETTTCSLQITGDPFTFSRLLHDPKFTKTGFFSGFLLVEAEEENATCDLDAMAQITADEPWRILMSQMLTNRLCDIGQRLHLGRDGAQCCLEFHDWYWNFMAELPEQHRWSFSGWPPLLVELALGMAIIEGKARGEILEVGFLRGAAEMLQAHAPRQLALLQSLQPQEEIDGQFEDRLSRTVLRLAAQGPMTKRDLARTISGNDYSVIDTLLAEAKRRGLIIQKGKHFVAVGVNVNASTGDRVIDFQEGVAA